MMVGWKHKINALLSLTALVCMILSGCASEENFEEDEFV